MNFFEVYWHSLESVYAYQTRPYAKNGPCVSRSKRSKYAKNGPCEICLKVHAYQKNSKYTKKMAHDKRVIRSLVCLLWNISSIGLHVCLCPYIHTVKLFFLLIEDSYSSLNRSLSKFKSGLEIDWSILIFPLILFWFCPYIYVLIT